MGRPAIRRQCSQCGCERMTSEFSSRRALVCKLCLGTARTLPGATSAAIRASTGLPGDVERPAVTHSNLLDAMNHLPNLTMSAPATSMREREFIAEIRDAVMLFDSAAFVASIAPKMNQCRCCFKRELDSSISGLPTIMHPILGVDFCILCAFQVSACGRCETHKSPVFFEALSSTVVPMVPQHVLDRMNPPASRSADEEHSSGTYPRIVSKG